MLKLGSVRSQKLLDGAWPELREAPTLWTDRYRWWVCDVANAGAQSSSV